jgi:hypothetical protein
MSANGNNKFMNSLLPLNSATNKRNNLTSLFTPTSTTNIMKNSSAPSSFISLSLIIGLAILAFLGALGYYYRGQVTDTWNNAIDVVNGYFNPPPPPPPPAPPVVPMAYQDGDVQASHPSESSVIVEKILPGKEVFNVSSNRYTYYDAEPLCKALGAELATYDQVKEAWNKGADWCNYGWVKGQMALYPTSDETYKKLQGGPEDQRRACGRPGINGGYFDNPEMRFGVTCVGNKPPQNKHDEEVAYNGIPLTPDSLEFDKKVAQFQSDAAHVGILPFKPQSWTS